MAALRVDLPEPTLPGREARRDQRDLPRRARRWSWDVVDADADATTNELIVEIEAASDETLADQPVIGPIMGDGSEHDLAHLGADRARASA